MSEQSIMQSGIAPLDQPGQAHDALRDVGALANRKGLRIEVIEYEHLFYLKKKIREIVGWTL